MPGRSRPLKVFLCHASADKPAVRELYRRLIADGVDAWLDAENLLPGQNWQVEIPNAVRDSDVVLVCVSVNSVNKEGYVQKEITFALDKALEMPEGRIFLIPARLEDCQMPRRLSSYQWVDLFSKDGYELLMKALRVRADQIGAEPPGRKGWLPYRPGNKPPASNEKKDIPDLPLAVKPSRPPSDPLKPKAYLLFGSMGLAAILIVGSLGITLSRSYFNQPNSQTPSSTSTPELVPENTSTVASPVTQTVQPASTPTTLPIPTATVPSSEIVDDAGAQMVLVPAGDFIMGSENYCKTGSPEFCRGEGPRHQISLDAFYIDKYEVSNGLYKACVRSGVCDRPTDSSRFNDLAYEKHPVVFVDWNRAKKYCEWRNGRLPTEAEWEKAARGNDERTYPWGEGIGCDRANYSGCVGDMVPVDSYPNGASPFGAYNMAGNAWEWVADWYDENYYKVSLPFNPTGPQSGEYRVLRGGKWNHFDGNLRTVARFRNVSTYSTEYVGFRCVRDLLP